MERLEVLQQKLEHWCAASIRALSKDPSVQYRGHGLFVDNQIFALNAPHLQLDFATHKSTQLRGVADGVALRLLHSNTALHKELSPIDSTEQLVFDLLEQLRCEALAPTSLPGMRTNLQQRFLFWAQTASTSKLIENDVGLLLFSLDVVCWSRLMVLPIPEQIEDIIEHTRWGFADSIGIHLRQLKRDIQSQHSFSKSAKAIATAISGMINEGDSEGDKEGLNATIKNFAISKAFNSQWFGADNAALQKNFGVSSATVIDAADNGFEYHVFSRAYDRVNQITKVIRPAQLAKLRHQLDKRIKQQNINTHRVARHLKQLVSSPVLAGWSFGEEQGYLDSARLTQLLSSPNERRLFRQEQIKPKSDSVVSIVVDNSGSMTYHSLEVAALVDTLTRALELADIKTEVLGFTTGDWSGGRVAKDWTKAGKPTNPGRLNSLSHTIYKSGETPWRRARPAISGMLRTDLFREGIDGEALLWALERITTRSEANKIIIMLSDGSPMDTSTRAANHERILDQHLAQVAQSIELRADVKLCALGVGLDLSSYYQESLSIDIEQELTTKDYFGIVDLLSRAV
ncbi:MAG: cobaltochelatase CobT [Cryomorphaceae bacterium]|jgi:cobaltochelatase CobT